VTLLSPAGLRVLGIGGRLGHLDASHRRNPGFNRVPDLVEEQCNLLEYRRVSFHFADLVELNQEFQNGGNAFLVIARL